MSVPSSFSVSSAVTLALAATDCDAFWSASVSSGVVALAVGGERRRGLVGLGSRARPTSAAAGAAGDERDQRAIAHDAAHDAPVRIDGRKANEEAADQSTSAAMIPNSAGPLVFESHSMIRLNE